MRAKNQPPAFVTEVLLRLRLLWLLLSVYTYEYIQEAQLFLGKPIVCTALNAFSGIAVE